MDILDFYECFDGCSCYMTHEMVLDIQKRFEKLFFKYQKFRIWYLFCPSILKFRCDYRQLERLVDVVNERYIQREMKLHDDLFSHIKGYALDMEQRRAVITDEENNLVVAGAGSGKTLTIIGKIRYLVEVKGICPEDILCISFTRDTTCSLKEAVAKETNYEVDVYTFHKLGMQILREHGRSVKIAQDGLLLGIIEQFFEKDIMECPEMLTDLVRYFAYFISVNGNGEVLKTMKNQMERDLVGYDGEIVGSYEEWVIANYFYVRRISYQYQSVCLKDGDVFHFYFPFYDVYLEYFHDLEQVERVRDMHEKNGTNWEEVYDTYFLEGSIFEWLDWFILKYQMDVCLMSSKEIYSRFVCQSQKRYLKEFQRLIVTFIQLFKSNHYGGEKFEQIMEEIGEIRDHFTREHCLIFVRIVYRIYLAYQFYLKEHGEYDFNDMINEATDLVLKWGTGFHYQYIIVDEYQDTSITRYQLIQALKKATSAKLMAVGDDWQSIYRFTGCDLNVFLKFADYFGYSKVLRIQNTYRNSQDLIDVAGSFVMKNDRQLRKRLSSVKHLDHSIRLFYYDDVSEFSVLMDLIHQDEVFILGRNNHDIDFLKHDSLFSISDEKIIYDKRPDLKITFFTVHRSKGLECKEVILINLENRMMGFPNQIQDDVVLHYVNDTDYFYPYEEERRLFYVALTRTKSYVYLFVPRKRPSVFVEELLHDYRGSILILNDDSRCPVCGRKLVQRSGKYGVFFGCLGYPDCDYTRSLK